MFWKTVLSHCIHHESEVQVRQNLLFRWFTFNNATIQSLIHRYHPERPQLEYIRLLILPACANPGSFCLLGLGGAGVLHALAPYYQHHPLHAVEINPRVIELCQTHFMLNQLPDCTVIHANAIDVVQEEPHRYQHLLVDLFDAIRLPQDCATKAFFQHCQHALTPDGTLAINIGNALDLRPTLTHISQLFQNRHVILPTARARNWIILAHNGPSIEPILMLLRQTKGLKQLKWQDTWGYVAVF